ncbi:hypothetical protein BDZ85DRAFT_264372 [Elsinoe ampelina]|uniref:Uncharacterized protein n=1 Tax=Elsinoe ampelina TaxID=302913 RepID=A0A6A6G8S2_9PEZI|nr:hypothetical protein BDZ85DRAFT_264372 [Elsinoe ampelina]
MSAEESQPAEDDISAEEDAIDDAKPEDPLPDYDWKLLEEQLMREMHAKDREMSIAYEEWADLTSFFSRWYDIGNSLENNRTRKRHKTQQLYVRHEEESLEELREGYVKVMSAFESAMEMLNRG